MGWARHVAHIGEMRVVYRVWWGPNGKRQLGRPRRRWEDNIKMDLAGSGLEAWTGLIWHRIGTDGCLL